MPKAIRVHEYGGPEVMAFEDVPLAEPGPGQIRVRQTAIGVNFIDIYFRSGLYKAAQLPFTPGKEGAGGYLLHEVRLRIPIGRDDRVLGQ